MDPWPFYFSDRKSDVDLAQLQRLFRLSAFWAADRQQDEMKVAIANSHPVITVWEQDHQIGFARATSDGIYRAVIWDVVIHPEYQGVGLGRQLLDTLLKHPHLSRVEKIYLMTSQKQGFYQHLGFTQNLTTTMLLTHQPWASITPQPAHCEQIPF